MCVGGSEGDTLDAAEQSCLLAATRRHLPGYGAEARDDGDAMAWIVIVPASPEMPRFTVCRIDPSLVVMVEDASSWRRFSNAASLDDAIAFICRVAAEARAALKNVHVAPELAQ